MAAVVATLGLGLGVGLPAQAVEGGSISGRVTGPDGSLGGVRVGVVPVGGHSLLSATTAADGTYRIDSIPAGSHTVSFEPPSGSGLLREMWQNTTWESPTPVDVTDGGTVLGIDAQLEVGGKITGTVTGGGHVPLAGAYATAWLVADRDTWAGVTTAEDGSYTIIGLPSGPCIVRFSPPSGSDLLTEYWVNATTEAAATPVSVTAGATTSAINGQLDIATVPTSMSLTTSANPVVEGAPVTWTATVSADSGTASGDVTFTGSRGNFGTVTLVGGVATLVVGSGLYVGDNVITARYYGNAAYSASSAQATQRVSPAVRTGTTLVLTSSANPLHEDSVAFMATVSAVSDPSGPKTVTFIDSSGVLITTTSGFFGPTGTVEFTGPSGLLGTAEVAGGTASMWVPASSLATGDNLITATYLGTDTFSGSSGTMTQAVGAELRTTVRPPTPPAYPTMASASASSTPVAMMTVGSPGVPPVAGKPLQVAVQGSPNESITLTVTTTDAAIPDSAITVAGTKAATKTADAAGSATFTVTFASAGSYTLVAIETETGIVIQRADVVAGTGSAGSSTASELAKTGRNELPLALGAIALLLVGSGLITVARRRETDPVV